MKRAILIGIVALFLVSFVSASNIAKLSSSNSEITVSPETVVNPEHNWQYVNITSKKANDIKWWGEFSEQLEWLIIQEYKLTAHRYTYCHDDDCKSSETKYAYYYDWVNVDKQDSTLALKYSYALKDYAEFSANEYKLYRIKYKPTAMSGKFDVLTEDSAKSFEDRLDPWWQSTNVTQGYVYLTNLTFSDNFESYDYSFGYGFETVVGWSVADGTITTDTDRVQGDYSMEINSTTGAEPTAVEDITAFDCEGDKVVLWLKHENISDNRIADDKIFGISIGQNISNRYAVNIYNYSTNVQNNEWFMYTLDKSDFSAVGSPSWSAVDYLRITLAVENAGSSTKGYFDHLYCYNSSNYLNTSRYNNENLEGWELQLNSNGYGYNSTMLSSGYLNSSGFSNWFNKSISEFDNFEIYFTMVESSDLGNDQMVLSFSGKWDNTSLRGRDDDKLRMYDTDGNHVEISYPTTEGDYMHLKAVYNSSLFSFYYSTNYGETYTLGNNFTTTKPDYFYLNCRQSICHVDNFLIRELIPTYHDEANFTPSYIAQDSQERTITSAEYQLIRDGTVIKTETLTYPTDQNQSYYFSLSSPGTYQLNVSLCDVGGCVWNLSQELNFQTGTLDIDIYDEELGSLINTETVYLDLIYNNNESSNYSTITGSKTLTGFKAGTYELFAYSSSYSKRRMSTTVSTGATTQLDIRLINSSIGANKIIRVIDEDSNPIEGATVEILRQYGANFTVVNEVLTNFEGETTSDFVEDTVYYKFRIYVNDVLVKDSEKTFIFSSKTELTIQTALTSDELASIKKLTSATTSLSLQNVSGTFVYTYTWYGQQSDVKGAKLELRERILTANDKLIVSNSSTASSGTLTVSFSPQTSITYTATGSLDTNTTGSWFPTNLDSYKIDNTTAIFGVVGLLVAWIMVGTLAALSSSHPVAMIVMTLVSLVIIGAIGIVNIKIGYIMLFIAVGGLIAFLGTRN